MNQWAFVFAAYAVVAIAMLALIVRSWRSMVRAEGELDQMKRRR